MQWEETGFWRASCSPASQATVMYPRQPQGSMLLMRALKPDGQCEPARKSRPPCPPSFLPAALCAPTTTLTWSPASQGQPHEQPGSASLLPSFLPVRVQSRTAQRWGDFQRNASSGDAVFARTSSRARTQTWTPRPHGVACRPQAMSCPRFSQAQEKTCLSGHAAAAVTPLPVLQQTFLKIITRKSVLQSSDAKYGVVST